MTAPQQSGGTPTTVPSELEATSTKLVYLCLAGTEGLTITALADALHMRKIALYSILGSLVDRGLVERAGETYWVTD
jgi:DNA-binding IclR family transcriptional regulator